MKLVVLLVILAVVVGWFFGRGRRKAPPPAAKAAPPADTARTEMLACAHCGVHLPRTEALFDAAGRPFCTPEHRVAGPR
jgi:uncharacterized protein